MFPAAALSSGKTKMKKKMAVGLMLSRENLEVMSPLSINHQELYGTIIEFLAILRED